MTEKIKFSLSNGVTVTQNCPDGSFDELIETFKLEFPKGSLFVDDIIFPKSKICMIERIGESETKRCPQDIKWGRED